MSDVFDCITALLHYCFTALLHYCITALLHYLHHCMTPLHPSLSLTSPPLSQHQSGCGDAPPTTHSLQRITRGCSHTTCCSWCNQTHTHPGSCQSSRCMHTCIHVCMSLVQSFSLCIITPQTIPYVIASTSDPVPEIRADVCTDFHTDTCVCFDDLRCYCRARMCWCIALSDMETV